jgi:hypothetical protein
MLSNSFDPAYFYTRNILQSTSYRYLQNKFNEAIDMYDNMCNRWDKRFVITIGARPKSQYSKLEKYRQMSSEKLSIEDFQKHTAEIYKLFNEAEEYYKRCEQSKYNLLRNMIESGEVKI